jgi:hypothetical protein
MRIRGGFSILATLLATSLGAATFTVTTTADSGAGSSGNTIGGPAAGAGNVIANNKSDGVLVDGHFMPSVNNSIRGNSITNNLARASS